MNGVDNINNLTWDKQKADEAHNSEANDNHKKSIQNIEKS